MKLRHSGHQLHAQVSVRKGHRSSVAPSGLGVDRRGFAMFEDQQLYKYYCETLPDSLRVFFYGYR